VTSRDALSILDFSLSANAQPDSLMAILRAYADESGKASDVRCRCISFAAAMGTTEQWKHFNRSWARMLKRKDIPYLHMKEVIGGRKTGSGPFAKFASDSELTKLMLDASGCIIGARLVCRGTSMLLDDLQRVLNRHRLNADPYSFTLYQSVVQLGTAAMNTHPTNPAFHLILDRLEQPTKRLAEAEELYESDNFASWRGWPAVTALRPKDREGSRELSELQAADFVAWILRRNLVYIEEWMRTIKPQIGPMKHEQWGESLRLWIKERAEREGLRHLEAPLSMHIWHLLRSARLLTHYPYDEERLENHVIAGRASEVDANLKAETIARAGAFPLTP